MNAIENPIFKRGFFKKNTWLYIKSKYKHVVIHLIEDSAYQLYAYDLGYDYKNKKVLEIEHDGCILLSVVDEMEDLFDFIIREATNDEIIEVENLYSQWNK